VTDFSPADQNVPSRLGVSFEMRDGQLLGRLVASAALCERGTMPMAPLVFLADAVAGVVNDTDPDAWTFTSEVSVRTPLSRPPHAVDASTCTLREGRRSVTCEVPLTVDGGSWGACFIGFTRVPRRDGDPPKAAFDPADAVTRLRRAPIEQPLRQAAGFVSVDPASGCVRAELRPDLLNPAGAMQGAIVASLAETAAEDLADHHRAMGHGRHVVTEMEVRYLAQNRVSPIEASARFVGPPAEGLVRIDLTDDAGRGRLTTAVMARVQPTPG
jgi:acyl-coenzyme A thioesterase PaaI-like protein